MSVNVNGVVGVVSWAPHDTPRRGISAEDMREAASRRAAGQGWQTIAKILCVNVIDLRAACADPTLDPSFCPKASGVKAATASRKQIVDA